MVSTRKISVKGAEISVITTQGMDYISLTDMVKGFGDDTMVYSWMRNRNTLEFIGIWEELNNPVFNSNEFVTFVPAKLTRHQASEVYASEADLLNMALFGITAKAWRTSNPGREGNIRDYAELEQLVVLSNLESLNAVLIHQGLSQEQRIVQLNDIAIKQMKSLMANVNLKKLQNPSSN